MPAFHLSNHFERVCQALQLLALCTGFEGELTEKVETTDSDVLIIKLSPQLTSVFKPGFLPASFFSFLPCFLPPSLSPSSLITFAFPDSFPVAFFSLTNFRRLSSI